MFGLEEFANGGNGCRTGVGELLQSLLPGGEFLRRERAIRHIELDQGIDELASVRRCGLRLRRSLRDGGNGRGRDDFAGRDGCRGRFRRGWSDGLSRFVRGRFGFAAARGGRTKDEDENDAEDEHDGGENSYD